MKYAFVIADITSFETYISDDKYYNPAKECTELREGERKEQVRKKEIHDSDKI